MNKIIFILCGFSVLLYALTAGMEWISRSGALPVGFSFDLVLDNKTVHGSVSQLTQRKFEKEILAGIEHPGKIKSITFRSQVYSSIGGNHKYHVADSKKAEFFVNNHIKPAKSHRFLNNTGLNRGFNDIQIRYFFEDGSPAEIRFFIKKHQLDKPLPYYYYVVPGSRLSKSFFYVMKVLCMIRSWGFILSLLILSALIVPLLSQREVIAPTVNKRPGIGIFFEFFCLLVSGVFSGHFLNQWTGLHMSSKVIWILSVSIPLIYLVLKNFRLSWNTRVDKKILLSLGFIFVMVYGYIFLMSGKLFPTEPIGGGDLGAHLEMIDYFKESGEFQTAKHRIIYPQSTHGFISNISDIFGISAKTMITPFLSSVLFMIFSLIFLLIRHFFPDTGFWGYLLALFAGNHLFFYESALVNHYFPPLISLFFLLCAIYFFTQNRLPVSSLTLALSLITYPLFLVMNVLVLFFLYIGHSFGPEPSSCAGLRRFLLFFSPAGSFFLIYLYTYKSYGFSQISEGFVSSTVYDPFTGMGIIFSLLMIFGLVKSLSDWGKNRIFLPVFLGMLGGFVFYYGTYYVFGFGTSHYLVKAMLPVIAIALMAAAYGAHRIIFSLKGRLGSSS